MRVWGGVLVVSALVGGCTALNPSYQTQNEGESAGGSGGGAPGEAETSAGADVAPIDSSSGGGDDDTDTSSGGYGGSTGEEDDGTQGDGDGSSTGEEDEQTTGEGRSTPHLVYLNYTGVELSFGLDDARMNVSQSFDGEFIAFESPEMMNDVVAELDGIWGEINVEFVLERPPMGTDYTMVVISPTNPLGSAQGAAPADCENLNPNSVAFVFTNNGYMPDSIAGVASRELGFAYGLELVDHPEDLMRDMFGLGSAFFDACSPLTGSMCGHTDVCGDAGMQNSLRELQERLGTP